MVAALLLLRVYFVFHCWGSLTVHCDMFVKRSLNSLPSPAGAASLRACGTSRLGRAADSSPRLAP